MTDDEGIRYDGTAVGKVWTVLDGLGLLLLGHNTLPDFKFLA